MTTTLIRRAGVLALIAATTTTLTGCAGALGATATYSDTEKTKITDVVLSGGGSGDVKISTAAADQTTIKRVVRHSANPDVSYKITGTTLTIDTSCGANCSVSYEIIAPTGVTVHGNMDSGDLTLVGTGATDVALSSGDLTVRGAAGPVTARTDSGDIVVAGATGKVTLVAASGDTTVTEATGPVDARVDSGDLTVRLSAPGSVTGVVSSGDVNVQVPAGSYRVTTSAGSGDSSVNGVTSDPAAPNVIDLRTGSGDVTVTAAA